jgi:hypothetical protein
LTTHVCQIFRACLARGYLPIAWGKLKWPLCLNPARSTILRLRHIVVLVYCLLCWK